MIIIPAYMVFSPTTLAKVGTKIEYRNVKLSVNSVRFDGFYKYRLFANKLEMNKMVGRQPTSPFLS